MVVRYFIHLFGVFVPFLLILFQVSSCNIKVTGYIGQDVTLPCIYDAKAHGVLSFCWGREKVPTSKCSETILSSESGDVTFRKSLRYQLLSRVTQGNVSLTILSAQREDAGDYGCRVEIPGWFNDQKTNIQLNMEEAPVEQVHIKNPTETASVTVREEIMMHEMEAEEASMATIQSVTGQGKFKLFLEAENIGRIAAIFLLTIILILILIIRRKELIRRKTPQELNKFTIENIYETIPVVK
ncbi:PREDICTED: T-cell immunoglobulin and mucin domain-containing protein 4-like [Cyprinodon variegatus]|uniref:T-cell immunoglobulin and mucin domain-containing protein 4-like n=1 Tax=Cyprinodon variegatus TaxID=28743 RepID=UPI00074284A3|nr:PREDICTED: T-cell immunoglobulin and mucin domain-containing protein 4-like [Cyprinodon variegatus]